MPLIIMTGIPCSGKTTRANELKNFFETKKNKKVEIISEEEAILKATYEKNTYYEGIENFSLFIDHFYSKIDFFGQ